MQVRRRVGGGEAGVAVAAAVVGAGAADAADAHASADGEAEVAVVDAAGDDGAAAPVGSGQQQ